MRRGGGNQGIVRHHRLMLVPLLTVTSGAAWAAPGNLMAAGSVAPIPPVPLLPDAAAAAASAELAAPWGRLFLMRPLLEGERLSQVTAEFDGIELRRIEAGSLALALGSRLGEAELAELTREAGHFLPVARLQALGIVATYNPANLTLGLALVPEAAKAQPFDFAGDPGLAAIERVRMLDLAPGMASELAGLPHGGDPAAEVRLARLIETFARGRARYPLLSGLPDLAAAGQRRFERNRWIVGETGAARTAPRSLAVPRNRPAPPPPAPRVPPSSKVRKAQAFRAAKEANLRPTGGVRDEDPAPGVTGHRPGPQESRAPKGEVRLADLIRTVAEERPSAPLLGSLSATAETAQTTPERARATGGEARTAPAKPGHLAGAAAPSPSPPAPAAPTLAAAVPTTGTPRVSRITMHPVLDGNRLSQVTAELTVSELRAIEAGSLELALGDRLAAARRTELKRAAGSFLPVARLQEFGIVTTYDPANLTISLALAPEAVGAQTFDFTGDVRFGAAERVGPADLALGITGNLVGSHDFSDPRGETRLLYNFAGFLNIGGRERGGYLLFGGLVNLSGGAQRTFERDRLIAFRDFEGAALRLAAGDLVAGLPLIAGEADIAGVSLERRYDALQPLRNIRPTGRRQFVLERPARIEIYANGALVQALDVNAGPVDLNRIPALSLSTNIAIIIEDATGRREIDSFSLANDIELLGAGISEFNLSVGLMRKPSPSGFAYSGTPLLTGQYARGFGDTVTAGGHFALMGDYQNVGVTLASLAPGGAVFLGSSVSHDVASGDMGYAVSLAYRGDPFRLSDLNSQLNVRLDYRSADYRRLSQALAPDAVKLDMAFDYRLNLTERVAVSLGGNYFESHTGEPATRAVFGGVQVAFGRVLASATARYAEIGGRRDRGVLATLTVPLGRNHFATGSFDSVTRQARFEARRVRDITVPEFDYGLIAEHSPLFDRITGQARFANSRFNLDVELVGTRAPPRAGCAIRTSSISACNRAWPSPMASWGSDAIRAAAS